VLSKCANPACCARFHYLHQGRLFKIETGSVSPRGSARRIEHFWLCESCAQTLTVALDNGIVTTRPLRRKFAEGAPQDKSDERRHVA
jgi:hypothetical protein